MSKKPLELALGVLIVLAILVAMVYLTQTQ